MKFREILNLSSYLTRVFTIPHLDSIATNTSSRRVSVLSCIKKMQRQIRKQLPFCIAFSNIKGLCINPSETQISKEEEVCPAPQTDNMSVLTRNTELDLLHESICAEHSYSNSFNISIYIEFSDTEFHEIRFIHA